MMMEGILFSGTCTLNAYASPSELQSLTVPKRQIFIIIALFGLICMIPDSQNAKKRKA